METDAVQLVVLKMDFIEAESQVHDIPLVETDTKQGLNSAMTVILMDHLDV